MNWQSRATIGVLALSIGLLLCAGCREELPEGRAYSVTIPPLQMILGELCGDRAEVVCLLGPGDSPHTFEPRPSQARLIDSSLALFYAGDELDGWAAKLGSTEKIAVFPLVPEELQLELPGHAGCGHDHGGDGSAMDQHFWMSPRTVREMLPALVEELSRLDPKGEETYRAGLETLDAQLTLLHAELTRQLAPYNGRGILLFHPSTLYLMHDFGIKLSGVIEPVPGKEPTPKLITDLVELAHREKIPGVFTEPQLPRRPAETIARETNLELFELDSLGGVEGRETYAELIRYNAGVLVAALDGR